MHHLQKVSSRNLEFFEKRLVSVQSNLDQAYKLTWVYIWPTNKPNLFTSLKLKAEGRPTMIMSK